MKNIISTYILSDMTVVYLEESGKCGMMIYPTEIAKEVTLEGDWQVDSLIQIKILGDTYPIGFSNGHTMRNSGTVEKLHFAGQKSSGDNPIVIETKLEGDKLRAIHKLVYWQNTPYISVQTNITNSWDKDITIEMLSSFSICGLSPFSKEERMKDINLYRLRSKWSAEGKLLKENFTSLNMEPSWQRYGVQSIRFGEVGSMPVRNYFPWVVVHDEKYNVMFGAQIYHNGSWQIELYGRDDRAALSGGLADREFGHWMKILRPNESFCSPKAVLSTCIGDIDDISYRLTIAQKESRKSVPELEKDLPIMFNEFCTTWGNPTEENIKKIVESIKGKGLSYFIIDAGWYAIGEGDWNGDMGDWNINQIRFPEGFENIVKVIRESGMIPGLWFEMECVGQAAEGFKKEEWQLTRDNIPIQTGVRRFWDMRNPEVVDYLAEKVIGILKKYQFGYLKVDYNDNIGIGCDGAESLGEGLRQYVEASKRFFLRISSELPELVIENCSSGGHRLEPSMQAVSSLSSFSDAHECIHIPVIAANMHRVILPEQSQIWAVLRRDDDEKRIYYSMINTFLGRMCLSGDIYDLSAVQWNIVEKGICFYKKVTDVIRDGKSKRVGNEELDYNNLFGYQVMLRIGEKEAYGKLLVTVHKFKDKELGENPSPRDFLIKLPEYKDMWIIEDTCCRNQVVVNLEKKKEEEDYSLRISNMDDMEGAAILLRYNP